MKKKNDHPIAVWCFKHLAISFITAVLYMLFMNLIHLIDDAAITGMYIVIVVVNCTVIICSKLNRILEKLDKLLKHSKEDAQNP